VRWRRYHTVPHTGAANMHTSVTSEVKRLSIHPVGCAGQEDPPHVKRSLSSIRQVRVMGMPRPRGPERRLATVPRTASGGVPRPQHPPVTGRRRSRKGCRSEAVRELGKRRGDCLLKAQDSANPRGDV